MAVFRWLHFSDFHQGQPEQGWLWPTVRDRLLDDLAKLHRRTGPWDLILFTGDLANRGTKAEYSDFDGMVTGLLTHISSLGQEEPLLLAVPGNHDLVRPSAREPATKGLMPAVTLLTRGAAEPDALAELFADEDSPYRKIVEDSFKNYQAWWQRQRAAQCPSFRAGLLPGDFSISIEKQAARLGIVGLNSAFLQLSGGSFLGKLHLHPRQIQAVCGGDAPDWMKSHQACLLMTHHPPDWLDADSQRSLRGDIAPSQYVAAHLFGHMHTGQAETRIRGGGPGERSWQGYSLFGVEQTAEGRSIDRRHGYSVGEIAFSERTGALRQWPRQAIQSSAGVWRIHADNREFELCEDESTRPEHFALSGALAPQRPVADSIGEARAGGWYPSEPAPTAQECASAFAAFRQEVARQSCFPRQLGLDSDEAVRRLAGVTLDELYVVPTLQEERRFVSLGEEAQALLNELHAPDLSPERRRHIREHLTQLDHRRWIQTQEHDETARLPLRMAMEKWSHWVVLGTPGAGKSTLLQYLAGKCADEDHQRREALGLETQNCPLLLPLLEYAQARQQDRSISLASYLIARTAGTDRALQVAVRSALAAGQALVLLDAMDEVTSAPQRRLVSDAITDFLAAYPRVRCVITSRPYGYEPIAGDVVHLRLPHFSSSEVAALVHHRQSAIEHRRADPDLGRAAETARDIVHQIERHQSVAELARNPLLLVMICELCQHGQTLPVERAQLYDRAIRTLLQRWNQWRAALPGAGTDATAQGAPLDEETLIRAFGEVALRQQRNCRSRPVMHRARLQRWLSRALLRSGLPREVASATARSYIQAAAGRVGLLEERGPRQFVFWHQTLQEYLAASCLARVANRAVQRLLRVADRSRWHEVLQLALSYLGKVQDQPKRAARVVKALMTESLPPLEAATHQRLCLAASCLAHNPWLSPQVASEILTRLAQALIDMPTTPLAKSFDEAARARAGFIPSAALSHGLVALCDQNFGYIGNTDVTLRAARILANGTVRSRAARSWCRRYLAARRPTEDEQGDAGLISSGDDKGIRACAALGLLRAGLITPSMLIAVSPSMRRDQKFVDDLATQLKALRTQVEPLLEKWLTGAGPSLDIVAAVLMSLLERHDAAVVDVLMRELQRSDPTFNEFDVYRLLHWHAKHSSEARAQLLSHLPELRDRSSDNLGDLLRSLARDSDAFLTDLLALLADPDSLVERVLLGHYEYAYPAGERARRRIFEKLEPLLQAKDLRLRYRAAGIVEVLGYPERATPALLECLQSTQPQLQLSAAERLLNVDRASRLDFVNGYGYPQPLAGRDRTYLDPIVVEHLRPLLRNESGEYRVCAAVFLVKLGQEDLNEVVDVLSSAEALHRVESHFPPHFISQRYPHRLPQLAARMAEHIGSTVPAVRRAARNWLSWLPSLPAAALEILRGHLDSPADPIRFAAASVLFNAKVFEPRIQVILLQDLRGLGAHPASVFVKPFEELTEPAAEVATVIVDRLLESRAAATRREPGAEPQDSSQSDPHDKGESERLADIANEEGDRQLARILIAWSRRSRTVVEAVVDKLIGLLRGPESAAHLGTVTYVIHLLLAAHKDSPARPVAEALASCLKDEHDLLKVLLIAEKLYFFGYCPQETERALHRCLGSPNLHIRFEAAHRLLPRSGSAEIAVLRALRSCLQTSDVELRWRVALCLAKDLESLDVVLPALNSLLSVEKKGMQQHWLDLAFLDPLEHRSAVFRPAGASPESPVQHMLDHLRSVEWSLANGTERKQPMCVLAASQLCVLNRGPQNNPELKQLLLSWLAHPDPARRVRALRCLLDGGDWSPEPQVESTLRAWLDEESWHLRKVAVLLLHHRPDTRALAETALSTWLPTLDTSTGELDSEAWHLVTELARQSDSLLHVLIQRYIDSHGSDWQSESKLRWMAQTQLARIVLAVDGLLSTLPLREALFAVYLIRELGGTTQTARMVTIKAWADEEQAQWPVDHLMSQLAVDKQDICALMVPYLDDNVWWRRESAVRWLLDWGYEQPPLASAIRAGLEKPEPEIRYQACSLLAHLGGPADRPAIAATLRQLCVAEPAVYLTSECLWAFRDWPELADLADAALAQCLKEGRSLHFASIIEYFLGRRHHHEMLRNSLCTIARTGYYADATAALDGLRKMGLERRSQLKILLLWLADRNGSLRDEACKRLLRHGLLSQETAKAYREIEFFRKRRIWDEPMEGLLSLAKSPLVPLLFAEQIRPDLVPAVERCVNSAMRAGDEQELAHAVRMQPGDSAIQRFARCWLFFWLRRRAKVLRVASPSRRAEPSGAS